MFLCVKNSSGKVVMNRHHLHQHHHHHHHYHHHPLVKVWYLSKVSTVCEKESSIDYINYHYKVTRRSVIVSYTFTIAILLCLKQVGVMKHDILSSMAGPQHHVGRSLLCLQQT